MKTFEEWIKAVYPLCSNEVFHTAKHAYEAGQRAANAKLAEALGNALYFMEWAPEYKDAKRVYEKHLSNAKGQDDDNSININICKCCKPIHGLK